MANQPLGHNLSSWVQLGLFTAFLFLLVAIPYTLYLRAATPKTAPTIAAIPTTATTHPSLVIPSLTPPPASTTTTCIPVPDSFQITSATPAAYLFKDKTTQVCYIPSLPPFPFLWQPYHSSQYGYSIATPNWTDKSTTTGGQLVHIFMPEDTSATASAIAFAYYIGQDPLASMSGYLAQKVTVDEHTGTIYTKGLSNITAIFQMEKGYFSLTSAVSDSALYAFQHMLQSLKFSK